MVHQVVAEDAFLIADALRKQRRAGIEQDACGLQGASGQDDNARGGLAMPMRQAVDVVHAFRTATRIDAHVADDRVADQREPAGPGGSRQRHRRAVEIRRRMTTALTLIAVVARRPPSMGDGQVRHSVGHHPPAEFLADDVACQECAAGQRHRRKELPVRKLFETFTRAADADETFHAIVVGRELCIADGPVFAVAVAAGGLEVVVTEPIALARPAERPPADLPAANPHERLVGWKGVGILVIVDEKLMTVVIAGVAKPLHRLVLEQSLLIAEPAKFQLVGPDVLGEIAGRHPRAVRLRA